MKKLIIAFAALAAAFLTGCTATKVEYSRNNEGEVKYKIEHNGHWLKTEAESMGGGMSQDGQFNIELAGLKSSPSEEFNKVMKTYTSAVVTLAQIAAAAYNPSASTASQSVNAGQGASTAITVNTAQTPTTDVKPDVDLHYNDAVGKGGDAVSTFLSSLTTEGFAAVKAAVASKQSGKITVQTKDGKTETLDCADGTCTTSGGTKITAADCAACKDCVVKQ